MASLGGAWASLRLLPSLFCVCFQVVILLKDGYFETTQERDKMLVWLVCFVLVVGTVSNIDAPC